MTKMRVPGTVDKESNCINVGNATKTGFIPCIIGGIFDSSYPNSKLRRGRVQHDGRICPTLTCNPDGLWIVDDIEYYNDNETGPEFPGTKD